MGHMLLYGQNITLPPYYKSKTTNWRKGWRCTNREASDHTAAAADTVTNSPPAVEAGDARAPEEPTVAWIGDGPRSEPQPVSRDIPGETPPDVAISTLRAKAFTWSRCHVKALPRLPARTRAFEPPHPPAHKHKQQTQSSADKAALCGASGP
jgi:hypothetical protein